MKYRMNRITRLAMRHDQGTPVSEHSPVLRNPEPDTPLIQKDEKEKKLLADQSAELIEIAANHEQRKEKFIIKDADIVMYLMSVGWKLHQDSKSMAACWLTNEHIRTQPNVKSGILLHLERRGLIKQIGRDQSRFSHLIWELTKLGERQVAAMLRQEQEKLNPKPVDTTNVVSQPKKDDVEKAQPAPMPSTPTPAPAQKPNEALLKEEEPPIFGAMYRTGDRVMMMLEFADAIELTKACFKLGISPSDLQTGERFTNRPTLPLTDDDDEEAGITIHGNSNHNMLDDSDRERAIEEQSVEENGKLYKSCDYCKELYPIKIFRMAWRNACPDKRACTSAYNAERHAFISTYGRAPHAADRELAIPSTMG